MAIPRATACRFSVRLQEVEVSYETFLDGECLAFVVELFEGVREPATERVAGVAGDPEIGRQKPRGIVAVRNRSVRT